MMDFQEDIVAMNAAGGSAAAVENARRAIEAARKAGLPVVFVRVAFREGHIDIAASNKRLSALKQRGILVESAKGSQLVAAIGALPSDPVVTKRRFGSFSDTDLQAVLRALSVRKLVMAGISTSGVMLSTVRQAADADFEITVLKDACADGDKELHEVLMAKVFPAQAEVVTVDEFVSSLSG